MIEALVHLIADCPRLLVLTGAGISVGSGIPTYRDDAGRWQRSDPIQHMEFIQQHAKRQRYWARSMNGWSYVARSRPNAAHRALAQLEALGHVSLLVTQNVDRLHQHAGSQRVVDLHGRLDQVRCRSCGLTVDRHVVQEELQELNPGYASFQAEIRPDGDAEVADHWVANFQVPACRACGGMLMPAVVFFGGSVPRERVAKVQQAVEEADAVLVVGSSLMVYSGYRFCRQAVEAGKPLAIINRGTTRADEIATLKLPMDGAQALAALVQQLDPAQGSLRLAH